MGTIKDDYLERVYAGWLGKLIGVRHGAPIEGWTYERIKRVYGEITDYLVDYKDFAADDDSNGPIFFIRALQDYTHTKDLTAEQIGLTWLNYAPYEHGFYWWGGYGRSTEHTAYQNMRSGIMAPMSGSARLNGKAISEQIGGQIFIDTWGLVVPGNYKLAAEYAELAASVAHDGNGIYGGMFIAACISTAFDEQDMDTIIKNALSVIPEDCEYARMVHEVIAFYKKNPNDWRSAFQYIDEYFGYHKYPGTCHIIPNAAVIILSLLYCEGDFTTALNICNMCGWDTDCNAANVGTIMGVRNGLQGIDYEKWRKPINDFLACSSVIGSMNILDVPWCACYLARLGYTIAGEQIPQAWKELIDGTAAKFHFELPGATHGFRLRHNHKNNLEWLLKNTDEDSFTGKRSLKMVAKPLNGENEIYVYHKTYYRPEDFHDSRYDPAFSPILYPGQVISVALKIADDTLFLVNAALYVKDGNSGKLLEGKPIGLTAGAWQQIRFEIPSVDGACLEEAGIKFSTDNCMDGVLVAYVDHFDLSGCPSYTIDFKHERIENWCFLHQEVSQFTYLKGVWSIEDGELSGSGSDYAEAYTGGYDWTDYRYECTLKPVIGECHRLNFRVQGAIRCYAVGLIAENKLVLYKNNNGYIELAATDFEWTFGQEYTLQIDLHGDFIAVRINGKQLLAYQDIEKPYLYGQIGVSVGCASHCHFMNMRINK